MDIDSLCLLLLKTKSPEILSCNGFTVLYVFVCVYVCMYVRVCVCVCVCVRMYVSMCTQYVYMVTKLSW
jgi:hypothetical protein